MGVPGVAQEGSRVSLGSKIEATLARNAAKRNEFERVLFPRGVQIVLTNKKEKLSLGAAGQNRATEKQKKNKHWKERGRR